MFSHAWYFLLVALAGWMNRQQTDLIEYLKEENRILREKLEGQCIRLSDAQKRRLPPAKGKVLCRERLGGLLKSYYRKAA